MSNEAPKDIDRAGIQDHAQRTVERTALRKVRKTLDSIEQDETAQRRTLHKVLAVCAALAVLGAWLVWTLVFGDRGMPKQQPMKVPSTVQPKNP